MSHGPRVRRVAHVWRIRDVCISVPWLYFIYPSARHRFTYSSAAYSSARHASFVITLIERNPPPWGGFLFTMFPHQELRVRGPPSKNLVQILRGGSSYTRFLMREHSKSETPPGGGGFFRSTYDDEFTDMVNKPWCTMVRHGYGVPWCGMAMVCHGDGFIWISYGTMVRYTMAQVMAPWYTTP